MAIVVDKKEMQRLREEFDKKNPVTGYYDHKDIPAGFRYKPPEPILFINGERVVLQEQHNDSI